MGAIIEAAGKQLGVLPKIWDDIFGPSAKRIGKALGAVTAIMLADLRKYEFYNDIEDLIYAKNLKEFSDRLASIEYDKLVQAPPELSGQILKRFEYVTNSELSQAFQTLLLHACHQDYASLAHPGYISIIDRMCPVCSGEPPQSCGVLTVPVIK